MQFIRKRFLLFLCILVIYSAYAITHFHATSQDVLGVSSRLVLFREPNDGKEPLLYAINASQKEIDIEVYLLSDHDIITGLVNACQRGVTVRVMLEEHPFGGGNVNQKVYQELSPTCVHVVWTNPTFSLTHEKAMLVDGQEVFILTQNLTTSSFSKNREYDIIDSNPEDVAEVQRIFNADWTRSSLQVTNKNLVVSPINARDLLFSLMQSTAKNLFIETEVIDDADITRLLVQKAGNVSVQVILPSFSQIAANKKTAVRLVAAGIPVRTLSSPYIHAKLIIADNAKAYIGSVNLTTQSMDENREVGIIIAQSDLVHQLVQSFLQDWERATPLVN